MADFSGGDVSSQGNLYARDIITGIQKNFTIIFQQPFRPPADLGQLRADYLAYLRDSCRYSGSRRPCLFIVLISGFWRLVSAGWILR